MISRVTVRATIGQRTLTFAALAILAAGLCACATKPTYIVRRAHVKPDFDFKWGEPPWDEADVLLIDWFQDRPGESHHPETRAKVMYDDDGLYVFFMVRDRWVRVKETGFPARAWEDSCVEFFLRPKGARGYLNFETAAGGALMASYIPIPNRAKDGRLLGMPIHPDHAESLNIHHTLEGPLDEEIADPIEWMIAYRVPFAMLEDYVGPIHDVAGQTWRANFFKRANKSSHPHHGCWSPTPTVPHVPEDFGYLKFER